MRGRNALRSSIMAFAGGLAVAALSSCGGDAGNREASGTVPGPVHVHGLGVNPADDSLFIATHTGLFRVAKGEEEAERVGDSLQDTMGFTVVGPDAFLGSGHPDLQQDLPPYLGLIRSGDAGEEWESVSLQGDADFHVLEAVGDRIYGFGSDFQSQQEQLLTSTDSGDNWEELEPPDSLISLAINPSNPDEVVASGQRDLYVSDDGGARWQPLDGRPGLLTWPTEERLYLASAAGEVFMAPGPSSPWDMQGELGGKPAAFEAGGPEDLFVALHDGAISESTNGGAIWSERSTP